RDDCNFISEPLSFRPVSDVYGDDFRRGARRGHADGNSNLPGWWQPDWLGDAERRNRDVYFVGQPISFRPVSDVYSDDFRRRAGRGYSDGNSNVPGWWQPNRNGNAERQRSDVYDLGSGHWQSHHHDQLWRGRQFQRQHGFPHRQSAGGKQS